MYEDFSDRTEAPTPRRREQFRRTGQVARAADLSGSVVLITALLVLSLVGPHLANVLEMLLRQALASPLDTSNPSKLFSTSADSVLLALAPLLVSVLVVAVVVNIAQIGLPLRFRMPTRKARAGESSASIARFFVGLLKLGAIGCAVYLLVASKLGVLLAASHSSFWQLLTLCVQTVLSCAMRLALVLLAFGLIDYAIQRYRLSQKLKMTRREREEELRQTEGDPKLRHRRRKLRDRQSALTRSRQPMSS